MAANSLKLTMGTAGLSLLLEDWEKTRIFCLSFKWFNSQGEFEARRGYMICSDTNIPQNSGYGEFYSTKATHLGPTFAGCWAAASWLFLYRLYQLPAWTPEFPAIVVSFGITVLIGLTDFFTACAQGKVDPGARALMQKLFPSCTNPQWLLQKKPLGESNPWPHFSQRLFLRLCRVFPRHFRTLHRGCSGNCL